MGIGSLFRNLGNVGAAAGDAGRAAGNAGGAARGAGNLGAAAGDAGRAAGNLGAAAGDAGRAAGNAGGAARAAGNDAGAAGNAAGDAGRSAPPGKEGGAATRNAGDIQPGGKWATAKKGAKIGAGVAAVTIPVVITAVMLSRANEGANNDGKTYRIVSIKNKGPSGKTLVCTFTPSIEPNGVVSKDSVTFSETGTDLDTKTYTIDNETDTHTTFEFTSENRLANDVTVGNFVLHTSFENQMDHEGNALIPDVPNPLDWLTNLGDSWWIWLVACILCIICIVAIAVFI
jgi:hypothetical protein